MTDLGLGDRHKEKPAEESKKESEKQYKCEDCGGSVTQAEFDWCKKNYGGKALCFRCQKK